MIESVIKLVKLLSTASVSLLFVGCAGLTIDQCQRADWESIGSEIGEAGRESNNSLKSFQEQCGKFDITPDTERFNEGYSQGLRLYCTTSNGYDEGLENNKYKNVCPAELEEAFIRGYKAGKAEYRKNKARKKQAENMF